MVVDARNASAVDDGSMSVADMKKQAQSTGDDYRKGSHVGLLDGQRRRSSVADQKIKLNSGEWIPQVALGVYKVSIERELGLMPSIIGDVLVEHCIVILRRRSLTISTCLHLFQAPNDSTTEDAVKWAFEAGYRHVDGGELNWNLLHQGSSR